jgi:hypothetical protein
MMKSRMMKCDSATLAGIKQAWAKRLSCIALGGAIALAALPALAPGAARAEDGDPGLFGSMLKSLGFGGENKIEYRERPPLVVPPTHDLPPPQTSAAVRDPNWPADPSGSRQGAEKQKKGTQVRDLDKITVAPRPAEPSIASAPNPPTSGLDTTATIPPSQPAASSGFFGNLFSSSGSSNDRPATPTAASTPARKSLTEPPSDYESPSPSQPYGAPTPPVPKADATKAATTTPPGASGL